MKYANKNQQPMDKKTTTCVVQKFKALGQRRLPQKLLSVPLVLSLSLSLPLSIGVGLGIADVNQANAAGLGDLFGDSVEQSGQKKFLPVEQAFSVEPVQNGNKLTISLNITPKHYLYKDKLKVKLPDGVTASPLKFSHSAQTIDDPNFGTVNVFRQPSVTATAVLTNTTSAPIKQNITVSWQGCADAGLCYPPQTEVLSIQLAPANTPKAGDQNKNQAETTPSKQQTKQQSKQLSNQQIDQNNPKTVAQSQNNNTEETVKTGTASSIAGGNNSNSKANSTDNINTNTNTNGNANKTTLTTAEGSDSTSDSEVTATADTSGLTGVNDGSGFDQGRFEQSSVQSTGQAAKNNAGLPLSSEGVVDQDPFGLAEHPWLALALLFLAGLGLAFTPCVLPMLPIVSNIVARQHTPTAKKGLMLSGSYALGVAVAYGILGAIIAVFGQQLGIIGWLQNPIILLGFAAIFVVLALYMLDVVSIGVPNAIKQKTSKMSQAGDKYLGSTVGSFIAGLLSALVVSPCVSAPLFGALLAVSTIGNPLLGFAALFMLGFGLSAPLMLLGVSQGNLMPKAGEWMNWVKQGFALMLFAVSLLLIERVLMSPMMLMLWSFWFMVVAVWAWHWSGRGQLFTKPLAIALAIWSTVTLIGAAAGSEDTWQPLRVFHQSNGLNINQAATSNPTNQESASASDIHINTMDALIPIIENNQKVLVDVTAEWCIECRIMDKTLFTNRPADMQQWQFVRLDVTESNEASARILSELRLFGPPALLYFVDGKLVLQQVGTIERGEFEQSLERL